MREVARLANVSVATVSMVLNDNPRITASTQLRVRRAIDKLNYRPNRLAQSLSGRYTHVLAVLLPQLRHVFSDPYFGELLSGVCDRADRLGHKVMIEHAKPDFVRDRQYIELFERRFIDGLLCLGFNDRHKFLRDFSDGTYPMVLANSTIPQWNLDHVICDYRAGAEQIMNCLLQLGHRKVGFIVGTPGAQTSEMMREVYRERMSEIGEAGDDTWSADGRFTEVGGAAAAEEIFQRHPDVTALFCGNDKMALGAMHQAAHSGRSVPRDLSIVGFDDLQHTAFVNPSLTTVHLPLYEVGSLACERLIARIHGKVEQVSETLPTHLVLRDSTAIAPR